MRILIVILNYMKSNLKKKVNLTIREDLLEKAKNLAEFRGESLSSLVEDFLSKLVSDSGCKSGDWLADFYAKYLPKGHQEPTDSDIKNILASRKA